HTPDDTRWPLVLSLGPLFTVACGATPVRKNRSKPGAPGSDLTPGGARIGRGDSLHRFLAERACNFASAAGLTGSGRSTSWGTCPSGSRDDHLPRTCMRIAEGYLGERYTCWRAG